MAASSNASRGRLLARFDCTQEFPPERYFGCGDVHVVESAAGRYREAEARPLSRFGYRFPIERIGRPHLAVIAFPDDKRRFMFVVDGTCYDLSTGVLTGFTQPLSGGMQELRQLFWPRSTDCSITFMTWGFGEPAAAASIEVYELDDLDELEIPGDPGGRLRRELGVQYEDPCGCGASEGALSREEWLDRVVSYLRHTGQTLLSYPIAWYHGPQYPSSREPADAFDIVVARDRKQYVRWTSRPPEWVAPILERFGKEGLQFQAVLTLLRLGSLMKRMNTDLAAIKAGAETINSMLSSDQVQAGTMDWTPIYNVRNFPKALEFYAEGRDLKDFPWAYGEKSRQGYHPGPIFNPLHPVVQEAVIGLIREIAERYGAWPAFKGVAITMWAPTLIWFGSLHSGYDDYTLDLFQKETLIQVKVDRKAPDRFSRRCEWLNYYCQPAWIEWRCRKVRALVLALRDALRATRPDLRLTLNLWSEPFVPAVVGWGETQNQLGAREPTVELYRRAGLDIELLQYEPGVELDLQLDGGGRDRTPGNEEGAAIERFMTFRDHDFLDRRTLDAMAAVSRPGVFIFNAWHEAWGTHRWFPCEVEDRQAEKLAVMCGERAEGIFRLNSTYPEDGFWWDSQLRITPAFPSGHFMEPYAHAVAELDALRITRGGLFLDKAHGEEIRAFARAYRALPRARFNTVGESTDPVVVREHLGEGKRFFYAVNRDYYPVRVELAFTADPGEVTDLASGAMERPGRRWRITLGSYELRSFSADQDCEILAFTATAPQEIERALIDDGKEALSQLTALQKRCIFIPGADKMEHRLDAAIREKRLAWLRRALSGYVIRKCRELLSRHPPQA